MRICFVAAAWTSWATVWTDANGDGVFADTLAERENRTHNLANEVTLQSRPDGVTAQIVTQPSYDDAGNYRQNFNSGSSRLVYTHDAWRRLLRVVRASGGFGSGVRGGGRVT